MSETVTTQDATPDTRSTVLDQGGDSTAVGAGAPSPVSQDDKKPLSVDDAINAAQDKFESDQAKKGPVSDEAAQVEGGKPETEAKPAKQAKVEPVEADTRTPGPQEPKPEAEDQRTPRPKFLSNINDNKWRSTPTDVKAAARMMETRYEEAARRADTLSADWEKIAPYAERAKASGTTIDVALKRFVEAEDMLRANPVAGFATLMRNMGIQPEQFARLVIQDPQQFQSLLQHGERQSGERAAQASQREIEELRRRLQETEASRESDRVHAEVIAPFRAANPRFDELQEDIAFFLKSDRIPSNLHPVERLQMAYDLADRMNPAAPSIPDPAEEEEAERRKRVAGKKSVSGSPSPGARRPTLRGSNTHDNVIARAMAQLNV